jgi:hypothetical protein
MRAAQSLLCFRHYGVDESESILERSEYVRPGSFDAPGQFSGGPPSRARAHDGGARERANGDNRSERRREPRIVRLERTESITRAHVERAGRVSQDAAEEPLPRRASRRRREPRRLLRRARERSCSRSRKRRARGHPRDARRDDAKRGHGLLPDHPHRRCSARARRSGAARGSSPFPPGFLSMT